jgi:hypothetical protein
MKRAIALLAVVGIIIVMSQLGWFVVLMPPEAVGERQTPVIAHRLGEVSLVEYFPFGSSLPGFTLIRTGDLRVDPAVVGSRLERGRLIVGEGREYSFPTAPALVIGGLLALTILWRAARRARLAQRHRLAT